ncbi:MAG: NAD(P)H-dependent glycerol-3-phosphate dehydrogenase [Eubacteriaceae bacterium]|nr:NAD(P)H-dependent glycerol-3-phosphate dehydrogenase [Eubacteriaceae bacterium]
MRISVQGCGRWGSFIAWYLSRIGYDVCLWGRKTSASLEQFKQTRKNTYLELQDNIHLTDDLDESLSFSDIIIVSISAQELRSHAKVLSMAEGIEGKTLVLCMKGLEDGTGLRLSQVVREVLGQRVKVAVWLGPGHVQDFLNGNPNCMVIDSDDNDLVTELVEIFSSDLIRFYYGHDLIGSEIGAAAKNVIGIASGILDGLEMSALKGALMARGSREVSRLIKAMGGNELTAYGLTHLGDYEATVFSKYSHNRSFGEAYVRGDHFELLAEGVATSSALMALKDKYNVELPISSAVYDIVIHQKDPIQTLSNLFLRSIKGEFV